MADCVRFLNKYASYLNENPDAANPRPLIMIFTEENCRGTTWYEFNLIPPTTANLPAGSIYIPAGNSLRIWNRAGTLSMYLPQGTSDTVFSASDAMFEDLSQIHFPGSAETLLDNIGTTASHSAYTAGTIGQWKYDMCMGKRTEYVGETRITSFIDGSPGCEQFMTSYCTDPNNASDSACVCLQEETILRDSYCKPDSTDPFCTNSLAFAAYLPVECFGKRCSSYGYRFRRMRDRECNALLCEQFINVSGDNNAISNDAVLWCGNTIDAGSAERVRVERSSRSTHYSRTPIRDILQSDGPDANDVVRRYLEDGERSRQAHKLKLQQKQQQQQQQKQRQKRKNENKRSSNSLRKAALHARVFNVDGVPTQTVDTELLYLMLFGIGLFVLVGVISSIRFWVVLNSLQPQKSRRRRRRHSSKKTPGNTSPTLF